MGCGYTHHAALNAGRDAAASGTRIETPAPREMPAARRRAQTQRRRRLRGAPSNDTAASDDSSDEYTASGSRFAFGSSPLKMPPQRGVSPATVVAVTRVVTLGAPTAGEDAALCALTPPGGGRRGPSASERRAGRRVQDECALCLADFVEGERLRVLRCGHHFHSACVDDWLHNWGSTCPLCCRSVCPTLRSDEDALSDQKYPALRAEVPG
eukprot:TRINITY_DN466_c0_g2_i1.p1 TRINITY_DN466_c0_g2~~TRINITY_DN466_c0_g2_i1.p1  ORF type:complete len:211 (+),score=58.73 TRINITY_DN466_c0_g2_i1:95-727(+)